VTAAPRLSLGGAAGALLLAAAALLLAGDAGAQHAGHHGGSAAPGGLPAVPESLPSWMDRPTRDHRSYRRGAYNFDIYNIPALARDLNAVAVGHAMAYEDLVTGRASGLETEAFARIVRVLKNPPRFMPDEAAISPTFGRLYGELEKVFDWTHVLHAQTVDVLASTDLSPEEKEREIEALWRFYSRAPWAVTGLPLNMAWLDSQPYSAAFRRRHPKVNGLFWGYHWLQGTMYDLLYRASLAQQREQYAAVGERYHRTELYRTDRPFMPMFAESSPLFAGRFPQLANAFDNLHMLHDLVNDILASDGIAPRRKREQIRRAVWLVLASTHAGEAPGETSADPLHDHRHLHGMPGMGMMRGATEALMFMPGMGWMSMEDCHHCSMPLHAGDEAWRNPSVSAEGWTMRVRCPLCARDMAASTRGRAILRIPLESPERLLVIITDEQGNVTSPDPGVLFLEEEASHAGCDRWSRAFSSRPAFDAYTRGSPDLALARPLTLKEWWEREGREPDTYVRRKGPVEDPYAGVR